MLPQILACRPVQHSTSTSGSREPELRRWEHEQRRRGEQEGRMNEKGSERIGGAEFILCLAGLHFFCIWDVKRGALGDSLFFSLPISIWDLANNRCVCLACQPTSQQYCSLITNQHQPSATAKRTQRMRFGEEKIRNS